MATFDFKTALTITFGPIAILAYSKLETARKVQASDSYSALQVNDYENEEENLRGVPMFMPCTLGDWKLPSEPIIDISGGRTIIKTQIDNQEGTFKELFAKNDYVITIRGLLCMEDDTDNYPKEMVRRMRLLCEDKSKLNIEIACSLTSLFGVKKIVVESYNFPAVEGFQSMQPYQLNCLSDTDIVLDLNNKS